MELVLRPQPTQSFDIGDFVGMKEDGKWLYGEVTQVHETSDDFLYDLKMSGHPDKSEVPQKQLKLRQRGKK